MQTYSILEILQHPDENGISIFVSGLLLTLSFYHFLLFFQHKDKAYLLYSFYTFLVFIYTYYRTDDFFLAQLTETTITKEIIFLSDPIKWLYTTVYILFAIVFIDLNDYRPKWNLFFMKFVKISFISIGILTLTSIIFDNIHITEFAYNFIYLPITFPLSLILLYVIAKINSPVKNYLLIGSTAFLLLSSYSHYLTFTGTPFRVLFYFSMIFETIFFALGLGAKQKILLQTKTKAQEEVIKEHLLNIELQKKVKTQLDIEVEHKTREIVALTKKNQEEEKRKIEIEFERETLELKMQALQTQMNPHFLFNALNSVKHFIITNKKKDATYFLSKLSRLIRNILDSLQRKEVSLYEEIEVIKLYLNVENIRLHKEIDLEIDIASNVNINQIKIPPLALQPFIENSIWHGLSLKKGEKKIKIGVSKNETHLIICIRDNGIGREQSAINKEGKLIKKESVGIDITKQRLESYTSHLTGKVKISFEDLYENDIASGTKVFISMPLEKLI